MNGDRAVPPIVRCYGAIRASLLPIAHDRQPSRISLVTATVPCSRQHRQSSLAGKPEATTASGETSTMLALGSDEGDTSTMFKKTCGEDISLMLVCCPFLHFLF